MDCEIITFEVERIVFFPLYLAEIAEFDRLRCKVFEVRKFELLHDCNALHIRYLCTKS
jgi:hypothetical protein